MLLYHSMWSAKVCNYVALKRNEEKIVRKKDEMNEIEVEKVQWWLSKWLIKFLQSIFSIKTRHLSLSFKSNSISSLMHNPRSVKSQKIDHKEERKKKLQNDPIDTSLSLLDRFAIFLHSTTPSRCELLSA